MPTENTIYFLRSCKNTLAMITKGTKVNLLSWPGQKMCEEDNNIFVTAISSYTIKKNQMANNLSMQNDRQTIQIY